MNGPANRLLVVRVYCAGHTWTSEPKVLTPDLPLLHPDFKAEHDPKVCPQCGAPPTTWGGPVAGPAGVVT